MSMCFDCNKRGERFDGECEVCVRNRAKKALDIAFKFGSFDGEHHKMWVIDQMVRALTGCPTITKIIKGSDGKDYPYEFQSANHEYSDFVRKAQEGEEGLNTYEWDMGIPP